MALRRLGNKMTVGDLQKILEALPDSTRVCLRLPAGTPVDQHSDTRLELHIEPDTHPCLILVPHEFDPAGSLAAQATSRPGGSINSPRAYSDWGTEVGDREEDAAYWFGLYLMRKCRDAALEHVRADGTPKEQANIESAVDTALNGVLDLIEGFHRIEVGDDTQLSFRLIGDLVDNKGTVRESLQIAPGNDLPIGYWKWRDGDFQ